MREYVFKKGNESATFTAYNLSQAYGFLRDAFGTDSGWWWSGTNTL